MTDTQTFGDIPILEGGNPQDIKATHLLNLFKRVRRLADGCMSDGRILTEPEHVLSELSDAIDAASPKIDIPAPPKTFEEITGVKSVPMPDISHLVDEVIQYVIEPICPRGTITILQGTPKAGKSVFALWLAMCAAKGLWVTELFKIEKPANVLFIEYEDNFILIAKNASKYLAGAGYDGYDFPQNLVLCDSPTLFLDSITYEEALTAEISAKKYDLVVIDTLSFIHDADDENSSAQMKVLTAALKRIAKTTDCSILVIHHTAKGSAERSMFERGRGSSTIPAMGDVIIDWGDRGDTDISPIRIGGKYGGMKFQVEYKRMPDGIQWIIIPESDSREHISQHEKQLNKTFNALVDLLIQQPTGIRHKLWCDTLVQLDIPIASAKRYIKKLVENKKVELKLTKNGPVYVVLVSNDTNR